MNYFVIQVLTKSEDRFIRLANRILRSETPSSQSGTSEVHGLQDASRLLDAVRSDFAPAEGSLRRGTDGSAELPAGFAPDAPAGRLLWPRRSLTIRRQGKQVASLAPIFPGYVFYEAEEVSPEVYWSLKRLSGFIRFLKNEDRLEKLTGADRDLLLHFLSYGEVVEKSLVYFDENNRIRVTKGPMKGLEGQIIKVDKRKRRAKIRLSLYSNRFLVDFGFELLEPAEGHERQTQ